MVERATVLKALAPVVGVLVGLIVTFSPAAAHGAASSGARPDWYGKGHRIDAAGDLVARVLNGTTLASPTKSSTNSGTPCPAETSISGNVQVNCRAEDQGSPQNQQSETSVAIAGSKVVVGFNDTLVCCRAFNLTGYSVSSDGGRTFTDEGDLPWQRTVQPFSDPSVASDSAGNFYYASLALSGTGSGAHSLISFYEMPAGTDRFRLVSVPVDVGRARNFFADKEYLAVAPDANGKTHFYITWTSYSSGPQSPIMLSDSSDGLAWRTTMLSAPDACAQASNPVPAGGTIYVSWLQQTPESCAAPILDPDGSEMMASVHVASAKVTRIKPIATFHGSGDKFVECYPSEPDEVIETQPGHDARLWEAPSTTIDANGVLYAAWNDRPLGVGGAPSNATRIYLSYSLDHNRTWSAPQVISGKLSRTTMSDRFQPWITTDASGLHAMWYHRVAGPGVDELRTDREDLSLASATAAPVPAGEKAISSVSFPVLQTLPQQEPVASNCYMGDYNNIASNGTTRIVTWGDNRNLEQTMAGTLENQADVFSETY